MAIQTKGNGATPSWQNCGTDCGWCYQYSVVTDDPASLTVLSPDSTVTVEPFTCEFVIDPASYGYYVQYFNVSIKSIGSYGFNPTAGTMALSFNPGGGVGTLSTERTIGGATATQGLQLDVNSIIASDCGYLTLTVSHAYQVRVRPGVGFNRGYQYAAGGNAGPLMSSCTNILLCSSTRFYPWYTTAYDDSVVQFDATSVLGNAPTTSYAPTTSTTPSSTSYSDGSGYGNVAFVFQNAGAGVVSPTFHIVNFNRTNAIYTIASGQLDIQVSNNGSDFVTYASPTSSGSTEVRGYSYVRYRVASGIVNSLSITMTRRRLFRVERAITNQYHYKGGLFKGFGGWKKGE